MAVVKEWECAIHGVFASTHPICNGLGCDSSYVKQVFITPPNIGSASTKRFDAGIRKSSDMYKINNFKSAREGEVSFGGRDTASGLQVLWGDDVKRTFGTDTMGLAAASPDTLGTNNGMKQAAETLGITSRTLPPAGETTAHRSEIPKK